MSIQELERARARYALDAIQELQGKCAQTHRAYIAYAKGLPASIVISGLGQAVAMAMSRAGGSEGASAGGDKEAWQILLRHLESWLLRQAGDASPYPKAPSDEEQPDGRLPGLALMQRITTGDQSAYLAAQCEALAILGWLKKFANALLSERSSATRAGEGSG